MIIWQHCRLCLTIYNITENNHIPLYLATFNVQDFTILLLQNGTTNIICYFAQNSSADGCQVKLKSIMINEAAFVITKNPLADSATQYTNILTGQYEVIVYDIVNGVINQTPAYSATYSVTNNTVLPSSG